MNKTEDQAGNFEKIRTLRELFIENGLIYDRFPLVEH